MGSRRRSAPTDALRLWPGWLASNGSRRRDGAAGTMRTTIRRWGSCRQRPTSVPTCIRSAPRFSRGSQRSAALAFPGVPSTETSGVETSVYATAVSGSSTGNGGRLRAIRSSTSGCSSLAHCVRRRWRTAPASLSRCSVRSKTCRVWPKGYRRRPQVRPCDGRSRRRGSHRPHPARDGSAQHLGGDGARLARCAATADDVTRWDRAPPPAPWMRQAARNRRPLVLRGRRFQRPQLRRHRRLVA